MSAERSRWALRRDELRGGPPRDLQPCGTVAAARRHQRAGEPLCEACRTAWTSHQHRMYVQRNGKGR